MIYKVVPVKFQSGQHVESEKSVCFFSICKGLDHNSDLFTKQLIKYKIISNGMCFKLHSSSSWFLDVNVKHNNFIGEVYQIVSQFGDRIIRFYVYKLDSLNKKEKTQYDQYYDSMSGDISGSTITYTGGTWLPTTTLLPTATYTNNYYNVTTVNNIVIPGVNRNGNNR